MLIDHFPGSLLPIIVILTFKVQNSIDVWLPGDILPFPFSDISDKLPLKSVTVGKLKGSFSPHQVFFEFTSISCVVCKFVDASTLFKTIFE